MSILAATDSAMQRPAARPRAQLQFDLTSLKVFIATAELGGVTKASDRLALATAAASRRIQDLEAQFGVALFVRRPHGMALTEAGRSLLAHARSIVHTAARMQDEAASYRHGDKGVVRIAACKSVVLQFLPADLQRCGLECPGVRIDLQEMNSQGVLQAMSRKLVDMGIFEASIGPVPWPTQAYRQDRLVVLAPREHALAQRAGVTLDDILPWEVIGLDEGSAIGLTLQRHAAEAGRVLRMRTRVGSFDSMSAMVAQGIGIGVMPSAVAASIARDPALRRVPIREPWARRQFLLCERPPEARSSAARSVALVLARTQDANAASAN
jgi:DNA-binding transcriptional LysR family regulator